MATTPPAKPSDRQPRRAEVVADNLRDRILSGEFEDGSDLPKQEELFDDFGVSMPSIREAMRILETEGLITVRRGNRGGAIVHRPQPRTAAYMFGLVLQSRSVPVADLALAMRHLDPLCAAMCASRSDRRRQVLPSLRRVHKEAIASIDDFPAFVDAMRRFHEEMARLCGNETIILLLGMLESIWYAHEAEWAQQAEQRGEVPDIAIRRRSIEEHAELLAVIEAGDAGAAMDLARSHQEFTQPNAVFRAAKSGQLMVSAHVIRADEADGDQRTGPQLL